MDEALQKELEARIQRETDGLLGYPQQPAVSSFWQVNRRGVYLAAARRVCEALPEGAPLPAGHLPTMTVIGALWEAIEYAFLQGRDVTQALRAMLAQDVRFYLKLANGEYLELCALCVWMGRKDLLERIPSLPPEADPAYPQFRDACLGLFHGNVKAADAAFTLLDGLKVSPEGELRLTAAYLLATVVHLKGPPQRARLLKFVRHLALSGTGNEGPRFARGNPEAEAALKMRQGVLDGLCQAMALAESDLEERVRALAEAHARKDAAPKWMFEEPVAPWQRALQELEAVAGAARPDRRSAAPKEGVISWAVTFGDHSSEVRTCTALAPCFRRPRGRQDGSDDAPQTLKAVSTGRFAPCCREADREIVRVLTEADYNIKRGDPVPQAALELLCRHRHVVTEVGDALKEVSFTRGEWSLQVEGAQDGLKVGVPAWSVGLDLPYAVRELDPETFEFYVLDGAAKEVLDVFDRHAAEDGTVVVPKEGLDAARRVLRNVADVMPLAGALDLVADSSDFARAEGETVPTVRLAWDGDVLDLYVCVRPFGAGNLLALKPGEGVRERLVNHDGKTVVLVRDLDAERKGLQSLRVALGDFEQWRLDEVRWEIAGLSEALNALSVLHGLNASVHLEWQGRRLGVSRTGRFRIRGSRSDWFELTGEVELDDGQVASVVQLLAALKGRTGRFVQLGENDYIELTAEMARQLDLLAAVGSVKGDTVKFAAAALPVLDGELGDGAANGFALPMTMRRAAEEIRQELERKPEVPRRLRGELRPYQKEGFTWLSRLAACGFGACLADDMGLGKTVQVIALLLARAKDGPSLVVAPASVCANWRSELERFAPTLRSVLEWNGTEKIAANDVVVTSYGMLVSRAEAFGEMAWNGVVLDESQAIKNDETKRAQAARGLRAKFRVAATGTPIENRLDELWSLFEFLNPGLLGPQKEFDGRFTTEDGRATSALKKLVHPFIMRRLKHDVLDDLPEKTEITLPVALDEAEMSAYEGCRRFALERLMGAKTGGAGQNRMTILAELTRLRRFCCHPSLVVSEFADSAKMRVLLQLLEDLRSNGHRALVFSQFTDYLTLVRAELDGHGWSYGYLDGETPLAERARTVESFQKGEGDFFLISLKAG